jgi:hypothetical protein
VVFARRRTQQAIVEIDDASSGFSNLWRWRSAVINAASSSTVIATSCSLMRPPTLIRYMVGGTYRPRHLLSQHLPTWDEWSSPDELIHPGDWPSISSVTSSGETLSKGGVFAMASAWLAETWQLFVEAVARCESGSGQLPLLARAGWAPRRSRHRAAASHGTDWAGTAGLVIMTAEAMAPAMNNTALT